jgi:ATP-binding cassette, subfamily B, bacterial
MFQLSSRAQQVAGAVAGLAEAGPFTAEIAALSAGAESGVPATCLPPASRLEARDVHFTYPAADEPVLRGVSITATKGEVVAVAGGSGSGKSTLVRLLSGLYAPSAGTVRWDDEPVTAAGLQASVAVVFQDHARLLLTLSESVRALHPATDSGDLERVLREAAADEFVSRLPGGTGVRLGTEFEGGVDLSAGEWQRLAVARALYAGRSALVLDEPTSALDAGAADAIVNTLRRRAEDGPVVVFTHDDRVLSAADRIYVLERGEIVWEGDWAGFVPSVAPDHAALATVGAE